jgi:hypothetical protein
MSCTKPSLPGKEPLLRELEIANGRKPERGLDVKNVGFGESVDDGTPAARSGATLNS